MELFVFSVLWDSPGIIVSEYNFLQTIIPLMGLGANAPMAVAKLVSAEVVSMGVAPISDFFA